MSCETSDDDSVHSDRLKQAVALADHVAQLCGRIDPQSSECDDGKTLRSIQLALEELANLQNLIETCIDEPEEALPRTSETVEWTQRWKQSLSRAMDCHAQAESRLEKARRQVLAEMANVTRSQRITDAYGRRN